MQVIHSIQNRIYEIRGERVMLDFDLAELYKMDPMFLVFAAKQSMLSSEQFMFKLRYFEYTLIKQRMKSFHSMSLSHVKAIDNPPIAESCLPYAFIAQGVLMLFMLVGCSGSDADLVEALKMLQQSGPKKLLLVLKKKVNAYPQAKYPYEALENLLDEKAAERKWESRRKIGFGPNNH
jgi:hypothetical protein